MLPTLLEKNLSLGLASRKSIEKNGRFTMRFRFDSTEEPMQKMKLKIEINNAEHFSVFGHTTKNFSVESEWFSGSCQITTFTIEEIMGTKLRALYQRKKGRDLFDFACAFEQFPKLSDKNLVDCFLAYMKYGGHNVTRAQFEIALNEKRNDPAFTNDIEPLLSTDSSSFNQQNTFEDVGKRLISLIPGLPWAGNTIRK